MTTPDDELDGALVRALLSCSDARRWVLAAGIGPELLAAREARVVAAWCLQHPDDLPARPPTVEAALGDPGRPGSLAWMLATAEPLPSEWAMRDVQRFAVARMAAWMPRYLRDQAAAIEQASDPSRRAILIEDWGRLAVFLGSTSIIGGAPHDAK